MSTVRGVLRSWLVDCSCLYWACWQHWRSWFKPLVAGLYCVVLLIALPLLVWDLYQEGTPDQFKAWFVAGIFVLLTIPVFLVGLMQHLLNYTQPHLQKHIIRILWIVPIYSVDSWLGLKFPRAAIYVNTVRECYEAYVLYNFLCYLLNFLQSEYNLEGELNSRPPIRQPIPVCCCPPWPKGMTFIRRCKVGVLQYTVVRVLVTITALITQLCGVYDQGKFKLDRSYVYLALINGISQAVALHSLIYFYKGTHDLLKPIHPVGKFLTIKAIVFFAFWQSVLIAVLVKVGALPESWKSYDVEDVSLGLQNFIICIEMLVAAIAHYFVFSHKPFVDRAAAQVPCVTSCLRMLDIRDIYGDVKEHFVDPIPRPKIPMLRMKRRARTEVGETRNEEEEEGEEEEVEVRGGASEMVPLLNRDLQHSFSLLSYRELNGSTSNKIARYDGTSSSSVNRYNGTDNRDTVDRSQDANNGGCSDVGKGSAVVDTSDKASTSDSESDKHGSDRSRRGIQNEQVSVAETSTELQAQLEPCPALKGRVV